MGTEEVLEGVNLAILCAGDEELPEHDFHLHRSALEEVLTRVDSLEAGCVRRLLKKQLVVHLILLELKIASPLGIPSPCCWAQRASQVVRLQRVTKCKARGVAIQETVFQISHNLALDNVRLPVLVRVAEVERTRADILFVIFIFAELSNTSTNPGNA